ncbi:Phosphatidylserine decarboxylase proenzyme [Gammaproteobacteria bacterium]
MSLNLLLQYLLPQHILSRLVANIANCRTPLIKNFIIRQYCKFYRIDMVDMLEPNPINYPTFNEFFIRALKPGARPITNDQKTIISPVDGRIGQIGQINANLLIGAKGKNFTLEQLFADNEDAARFHNANFAILYLAPSNYHRIHMPISGKLRSMRYVPGKLFSVNPKTIDRIPGVFARNERIIVTFDTIFGTMAMVLVGAMIVGSIETSWAGVVMPNKQRSVMNWDYTKREIVFEHGLEIANFKLGSTVILLFPEKAMQWNQMVQKGSPIKMGQNLGTLF